MSRYLEEAAELLRKAATAHDREHANDLYPASSGNEGRERIAQGFATLAAIDKGLLPADITADVLRSITDKAAA